jgi:hypothetical protein
VTTMNVPQRCCNLGARGGYKNRNKSQWVCNCRLSNLPRIRIEIWNMQLNMEQQSKPREKMIEAYQKLYVLHVYLELP